DALNADVPVLVAAALTISVERGDADQAAVRLANKQLEVEVSPFPFVVAAVSDDVRVAVHQAADFFVRPREGLEPGRVPRAQGDGAPSIWGPGELEVVPIEPIDDRVIVGSLRPIVEGRQAVDRRGTLRRAIFKLLTLSVMVVRWQADDRIRDLVGGD